MEFQKKDFLNTKEILTLIKSDYTNEKATIISKKLINYCFVTDNVLYILHDNVTYERVNDNINKKILYYTSLLIEESFKKISYEDLDEIKEHYSKNYKNIFKNSNIESYYPQLSEKLEKNILYLTIHYMKYISKMDIWI